MDINNAVVIKTSSYKDTEMAKRVREVYRQEKRDVILVPYGVTDLFITIEEKDGDEVELIVSLQQTDDGWNPVDLDIAKGFDSIAECWEYARLVMSEAGLPEDSCDADVWEVAG